MTIRFDPTIISCGAVYELPHGRTLWHYPPLGDDADADAIAYRRRRLAQLRERGHWVCDGDMHALALALSEELTP